MTAWAIWLIVGVIMLVLEVIMPGTFYFLCLSAGCFLAALVAFLLGPHIKALWWMQWIAFIVGATLATAFSRRLARRITEAPGGAAGADALVGHIAVVVEEIVPLERKGRVRVDGDEWRAVTQDDSTVPEGAKVKVVGVRGARLVVEFLPEGRGDEKGE